MDCQYLILSSVLNYTKAYSSQFAYEKEVTKYIQRCDTLFGNRKKMIYLKFWRNRKPETAVITLSEYFGIVTQPCYPGISQVRCQCYILVQTRKQILFQSFVTITGNKCTNLAIRALLLQ